MRRTLLITALLLWPLVAAADTPPVLPAKPPAKPVQHKPLDVLFAELGKAGSAEDAKPIEDEIQAIFQQSGSASVDLLMLRASAAEKAQDLNTARKLLIAITAIAPDYAEGWRRLGELQGLASDDAGAMVSLQKAVTLNRRQFAALSELGDFLEDYGDKKAALAVFRKVQALDPTYNGVDRRVRELAKDVEGQSL